MFLRCLVCESLYPHLHSLLTILLYVSIQAPDPASVRPLPILRKTLELIKQKWEKEHNYTYMCDQFKSMRQDLTVCYALAQGNAL